MNALLLVAGLLCAAPASAFAEEPAAAPKAVAPEAAAEAAVKELEVCLDNLQYFNGDLKKKEAELDKEFKGKVPSAFVFLMNMKRGRVTRQQEECAKMIKLGDAPLAPAEAELRSLVGGSADYNKKRKNLDELRNRLNKTLRAFPALSR
ncbi:MAG: hypothetical protein ABL955_07045 [Elusimicrobiota bacterium]